MSIYGPVGFGQLTGSEVAFVHGLAGLSYVTGDILYYNGANLTRLAIGSTNDVLTVSGGIPSWSASGASGANTALSNLASVSINTSLLAQTGVDLGSTTKPFRDAYLWGSGTFATTYLKLTGTPTSTRTWTIQDATDTFVGLATTDTLTNKTLTSPKLNENVAVTTTATKLNFLTSAAGTTGTTSTNIVFSTSPVLTTPTLGVASATSLATSAASPLLLTNGQLVTIALTSQTTGATTLTIPDFASVADEFVFKTKSVTMSNKTFVAPVLGAATATSINGNTFTTGSYTLTGTAAKTLNFTNTLTLSGTDSTTMTFPTTSATIARTDAANTFTGTQTITTLSGIATITGTTGNMTITAGTGNSRTLILQTTTSGGSATTALTLNADQTATFAAGATLAGATTIGTGNAFTCGTIELGAASDTTLARVSAGVISVEGVTVDTISATNTLTNKRITKRATSTTQSATPTINTDNTDVSHITGLAQAITSMTTNLSGTPVEGDSLRIDITDNGTARAITWGTSFEASTVALPTTTVISTRLDVGFFWNTVTSKWRCVAVA